MEERDEQLIERFLAGGMTSGELAELAERRSLDPVFNREVEEYILARKALVLDSRDQLRVRFESLDKELDNASLPGKEKSGWRWILMIVSALLVLGFLAWKFLFYPNKESLSVPEVARDTIQQTIPQPPVDSTSLQHDQHPEMQNQKAPPSKDAEQDKIRSKEKEIFADHFEPYRDAMMDPTTRGDTKPTDYDLFRQAYWNGEYTKVEPLFAKLESRLQQNDNNRFQLANALLATGKIAVGVTLLEEIIKNSKSKYSTEAHLQLGLGYLYLGQEEKAKKEIELYLTMEKAKNKEAGEKILNALKN